MVRGLIVAIAIMTIAIVVIFGAMVAKLLSPTLDGAWEGTIDFAAAPIVEIGLPPGARVIASHVSAERVTLEIETVEGERSVYTTPLAGFDAPARLVFHTLE
jgi:hypothetical protein